MFVMKLRRNRKRTENVENEIETIDQLDTEPNHLAAHDQPTENPPHQSAMLSHRRDAEVGEDQNENENIINAERVLDDVAGQEFERFVRTTDFPDQQIEQEGENDPNRGALSRRPHT